MDATHLRQQNEFLLETLKQAELITAAYSIWWIVFAFLFFFNYNAYFFILWILIWYFLHFNYIISKQLWPDVWSKNYQQVSLACIPAISINSFN